MCLAIPALITEKKSDNLATAEILGVTREVALDLTPQANVGDYVLVHAGFAIEVIDAEQAEETIEIVRELDELASEDLGLNASAYQAASSQAARS